MTTNPGFEDLNKQCERSITKMSDAEALAHIGKLIDDAFDASFERGGKRALYLLDELSKRKLGDSDGALAAYFRANTWAALSHIANFRQSWSWEAPERQAELLALSRASSHAGFASLDKIRRCQILTNHANLLNTVGRTIDAIAVWDAALKIIPGFAMALGNRGDGLTGYARMMVDDRERAILALHAFDSLRSTMAEDAFHDSVDPQAALAYFAKQATELAGTVDIDSVRAMQDLHHGNQGRSKIERTYRRWCLEHRLFLCPLDEQHQLWYRHRQRRTRSQSDPSHANGALCAVLRILCNRCRRAEEATRKSRPASRVDAALWSRRQEEAARSMLMLTLRKTTTTPLIGNLH